MTSDSSKTDRFQELTWEHIEAWAGSRTLSRGQGYQRGKRVDELAITPAGGLIAWVLGSSRYTTFVEAENGVLASQCTCPYGQACKHAVAVVLEYLEKTKKGVNVPIIGSNDKRPGLLTKSTDHCQRDDENDEIFEEEGEDDDRLARRSKTKIPLRLEDFLESMTRDELLDLLRGMAKKYPSVREDLQHRQKLSKGAVKNIVGDIRKEIRALSEEPAWRNHWNDEGHIPDYSRVEERLESLLEAGHADEVIALGEELLTEGTQQVEMSHDEGETAEEISSCLEVVFRALSRSSLSPADQMLWAIDAELEDEYDLCCGSQYFWKEKHETSDWSAVADELLQRLNGLKPDPEDDDFSRNYQRDKLTDRIILALENANRREEAITLCEQEAENTGSYTRLVHLLLEANRKKDAVEWIRRGIEATQKTHAGVANSLINILREMREKENNWVSVAAIRAEEFFSMPSSGAYDNLWKASEKARLWPAVRMTALRYLETGQKRTPDNFWPLPEAEIRLEAPARQNKPPMIDVLLDIAIEEKRPDDIVKWYDHGIQKRDRFHRWGENKEDSVAQAIQGTYPERAVAIWKNLAEKQIALTKPSAYETAAHYLKKLRDLLFLLNRLEQWRAYLLDLRKINARKPRLLQTLARLEGKKIVDGKGC
jgi:uncharacterized Zn finger protein